MSWVCRLLLKALNALFLVLGRPSEAKPQSIFFAHAHSLVAFAVLCSHTAKCFVLTSTKIVQKVAKTLSSLRSTL